MKEIETYYPKTKQEWREWLIKNHIHKDAVWLICYKQKTGKPTLTWSEAVDEALCFGWIDSVKKTLDEEKFIQYLRTCLRMEKPCSVAHRTQYICILCATEHG